MARPKKILEPSGGMWEDLDCIFTSPEFLADDSTNPEGADPLKLGLRTMYEILCNKMQNEASGLPMNTVQQILLERIARAYVKLRYLEAKGEMELKEERDYTMFWMALASQFNSVLLKHSPSQQQAAFVEKVANAVIGAIDSESDEKLKARMRERMANALESVGM